MSEQNKIDEIKEEHRRAEEVFQRNPEMRDKYDKSHEYIGCLLAEIERKNKYLERISVTFGEFECQRLAREAL